MNEEKTVDDTKPVRFEDQTGRVRWQPRCGDSFRVVRKYTSDKEWVKLRGSDNACLSRYRYVASWIGRRESRRRRRVFVERD